jgi:predicted kinase
MLNHAAIEHFLLCAMRRETARSFWRHCFRRMKAAKEGARHQNPAQVLHETAAAYKVDTDAVAIQSQTGI